jgi:hypothetical protein
MTSTKPTYGELLRDPRWQRKRLEIMQREDFTCEFCHRTDATLNVHHGYYERGQMPWEYPDSSLHCLCEHCHEWLEQLMREMKRMMGRVAINDLKEVHALLCALRDDPAPVSRKRFEDTSPAFRAGWYDRWERIGKALMHRWSHAL